MIDLKKMNVDLFCVKRKPNGKPYDVIQSEFCLECLKGKIGFNWVRLELIEPPEDKDGYKFTPTICPSCLRKKEKMKCH
jgi:hypothetical protein